MYSILDCAPYGAILDRIIEDYKIPEVIKDMRENVLKPQVPKFKDTRRGKSMSPKEFGQLKYR